MRQLLAAALALLAIGLTAGCATAPAAGPTAYHLIEGSFPADRGPDGNSIFLDAPDGLILVDTGRHPAHRDKLLDYARARGRPIVAILNTHWHLDHSTGNGEIRAAYPRAPLFATNAVEGALATFLRASRERSQARLAAGQVPAEREAEVRRFLHVMDHPETLRPTRPVTRDEVVSLGGRRLELNVAPFAATEADLWIRDPAAGLVIVGDLVVAEVPFMDTACAEGWRRALDRLAATPFTTLIPGHGAPMDRSQFLAWRTRVQQSARLRRFPGRARGLHRRLAPRRGSVHRRRPRGADRRGDRLLYRQPPARRPRRAAALLPLILPGRRPGASRDPCVTSGVGVSSPGTRPGCGNLDVNPRLHHDQVRTSRRTSQPCPGDTSDLIIAFAARWSRSPSGAWRRLFTKTSELPHAAHRRARHEGPPQRLVAGELTTNRA